MPDLVQAMNIFYFVGHFVLTGVFFTWLYFRSRDGFRSVRNAFLIATAIALFIHWQFPTAPPRLRDVGLTDTLRAFSGDRHRLAALVAVLEPGRRGSEPARRLRARCRRTACQVLAHRLVKRSPSSIRSPWC